MRSKRCMIACEQHWQRLRLLLWQTERQEPPDQKVMWTLLSMLRYNTGEINRCCFADDSALVNLRYNTGDKNRCSFAAESPLVNAQIQHRRIQQVLLCC